MGLKRMETGGNLAAINMRQPVQKSPHRVQYIPETQAQLVGEGRSLFLVNHLIRQ